MYVGSKDYVLSLDLHDINREPLIIHWAASPQRIEECVLSGKDGNDYIFYLEPERLESGKGKCPYDPKLDTASALINEELYAGVYIDFMGTDAAIFRTLGKQTAMRTDQYNSRWLNEPSFIHAELVPDSAERNDDKLYFFFRERSAEAPQSPAVYARIGRICLNDDGGHCCLVNKWSTFLKARLVCSVPGEDGIETHFDELQDVFVQQTQDVRNPVIYAVFTSSGSVFRGSAVCVYSMADIRMVFNGPFAHKEGPNYQWMPFSGKMPYPRPGTCPGGTFTPSMKSTKDYPDEVINFMRSHPLMYQAVYPLQRRPLVVRTGAPYRLTTVAVDQVDAADGRYEVLFLGTDRGTVQKVIVLPKDDQEMEELMLEEVEVFKDPAPVKTMTISSKRQQLYVASAVGVTHLSLHRCQAYGAACADCCLARDPYCAWDGQACSRYTASSKRRSRRQDVRHGNPIRQCRGFNSNGECAVHHSVEPSAAHPAARRVPHWKDSPMVHRGEGAQGFGDRMSLATPSRSGCLMASPAFMNGCPVCAPQCCPLLACSLPRGNAASPQRPLVLQPTRMPWSRCSMVWRAVQPSLSASPAHPRQLLSGCSSEIPVTGVVRSVQRTASCAQSRACCFVPCSSGTAASTPAQPPRTTSSMSSHECSCMYWAGTLSMLPSSHHQL
uniref:Semaphorin 3F n=1 Tax=Equus asinus TaxID=9793 RepID=A0A8C4LUP2_EQUAS